jgi:exopolysaccharide biosynthesis polyprenyl glycosylphosphotransferase
MKKHQTKKIQQKDTYFVPLIIIILLDFSIFAFSFLFAYWIRFHTAIYTIFPPPPPPYIPDFNSYMSVALFIGVIGVVVFERIGLYERRIGLDRQIQSGSLILATLVSYIFLMAFLFNYREISYSRLTTGLAIPFTCIGMLAEKSILKKIQIYLINKGMVFHKTVIIGPLKECSHINYKLQQHHGSKYQLLGYITPEDTLEPSYPPLNCLGTVNQIEGILKNPNIDNAIIALPSSESDEIKKIIQTCDKNNIRFQITPVVFENVYKDFSVEKSIPTPVILFDETPMSGFNRALKRTIDIVISSTALVISSPIMLIAAILVKLDSKGPIFYVQERVGSDGSKFKIYKFRSMIDHAENGTGPKWATANDPRTTKIGRFLRRYNLDEFPQFLNVFFGDMSLVGPRPERPYFVDQFKGEIPNYMKRHYVKTGITGWAQVNGWRGDTSVSKRTEHDIYYIENWSILLDLKILWKTLTSFKNAY